MDVDATLIVFTDFPEILSTSADALYPDVPSLSKMRLSPILYWDPPKTMSIFSTNPGEANLVSIVWSRLFGNST